MIIDKIISGGQTGADQGGLEAGKALGILTGGYAPMKWMTETGSQQTLLESYGLKEAQYPGYPYRTRLNITNADGTVIFGNITEPGSKLTVRLCRDLVKLYVINPRSSALLRSWLISRKIKILNVAGNRESINPGIQSMVREMLINTLKEDIHDQQSPSGTQANLI
jgi:hypothetical protein